MEDRQLATARLGVTHSLLRAMPMVKVPGPVVAGADEADVVDGAGGKDSSRWLAGHATERVTLHVTAPSGRKGTAEASGGFPMLLHESFSFSCQSAFTHALAATGLAYGIL